MTCIQPATSEIISKSVWILPVQTLDASSGAQSGGKDHSRHWSELLVVTPCTYFAFKLGWSLMHRAWSKVPIRPCKLRWPRNLIIDSRALSLNMWSGAAMCDCSKPHFHLVEYMWMRFFFNTLKPNFWLLRYMLSPLSQTIFPDYRNWQAQAIWRSWLALNALLWSWWIRPIARLPGCWRRKTATGDEQLP